MLRTYQPKKLHRKKEHGFRKECQTETAVRFWLVAEQREERVYILMLRQACGKSYGDNGFNSR